MNKPLDLVSTVISPLILLLLAAGSVCAAEADIVEVPAADAELLQAPAEPEPELLIDPGQLPEYDRHVDVLEKKGGSLGYSFLFKNGNAGRALEYGFLDSSRAGGVFYRHMEKDSNLELEGFYLNENDYHGDLLLDYRGDYRLHLRTESLYHNLDRELLFTQPFDFFSNSPPANPGDPPVIANYAPSQLDAGADYGVSVVQDRADFRYRLHNFPLHLNLGYWRYQKEGTVQQIFADTSFEGMVNRVFAEARPVSQQVQEGRLGFDAHLGPVDLIYDFKFRSFEDRLSTPVALYQARDDLAGNPVTLAGMQQHNDNPDSRFYSHTVKLHSSMSGGLVAGASYAVEQRENLSRLTDTTGVQHARTYLQNAAGDFVYTPNREYTFSVKYRRQEVDHGNRGAVLSSNLLIPATPSRPPVDTVKDIVIATVSYRPRLDLSLVGEYRGDFLQRKHVSLFPSDSTWALPENSNTNTASLAAHYRPIKGLRTSAHLTYAATDHPSYGASFGERREGKLLANYTRSNVWGLTAHAMFRHDKNDEVPHYLILLDRANPDPVSYVSSPLTYRDKRSGNSNLGAWFVPLHRLTLGVNYSYQRNKIDQPVLFTGVFVPSQAGAEYLSRAHVYSLNASYAATEKLDLSLSLQQSESTSTFTPESAVFTVGIPGSTTGIGELSQFRAVQRTVSARGEYRFSQVLSTSLEYTFRDYDDKNPENSIFDGSAHAIVAVVAAKW
ncbi:putative lipoprotein [Citrifermentans bremense]|uniref:Putative lipoprotein n=1 Tax=Citrifermentans bremense TaxID=60035 RepID=A0A6S6M301_9BACT|nr:MtrB/PioB family outer membrane beta-barrel protein [Citrifermentans bremense]BCG46336.1 putative lipoprotein [Citrifermentans bremense]